MPTKHSLKGKIFYFCTKKMILNKIFAENIAYLAMMCSVCLKNLSQLDNWRTKEQVLALNGKSAAYEEFLKVMLLRNGEKKKIQQKTGPGSKRSCWPFS